MQDEDTSKLHGPFRVWDQSFEGPGIAVSRSIGDTYAKTLGVIATPIVQTFDLDSDMDLFLIMASDGVWDTIEN